MATSDQWEGLADQFLQLSYDVQSFALTAIYIRSIGTTGEEATRWEVYGGSNRQRWELTAYKAGQLLYPDSPEPRIAWLYELLTKEGDWPEKKRHEPDGAIELHRQIPQLAAVSERRCRTLTIEALHSTRARVSPPTGAATEPKIENAVATTRRSPPEPEKAQLTVDELRRGADRIQKRIKDLDAFDPASISKRWDPKTKALEVSIDEALAAVFGHGTVEYQRYDRAAQLDHGPIIAGGQPPPLAEVRVWLTEGKDAAVTLLTQAVRGLKEEIEYREAAAPAAKIPRVEVPPGVPLRHVFIGHGRSLVWLQLKGFLTERLHLSCNEFNSEPPAGKGTTERLQELLEDSDFAFLVMTAEDDHADGSAHARENVIHEAGLFQGKLGFERAIILLEDGCAQFSNIHGLTHIAFPKGNLKPAFEEIRRVVEARP
jgi:predicted nucleotide-binding protein